MKTQKRVLLLRDTASAPGLMILIRGDKIDVITRFSDSNQNHGSMTCSDCDILRVQRRGAHKYYVEICWTSGRTFQYCHDHNQIERGAKLAARYDYWQSDNETYMTPKTARIMYNSMRFNKSAIIQRYWSLCNMFYGDLVMLITTRMLELFRYDTSWYNTM